MSRARVKAADDARDDSGEIGEDRRWKIDDEGLVCTQRDFG